MEIPFVDLKKQYLSIKTEIDEAIQSVINETAFIKGKYVKEIVVMLFAKRYTPIPIKNHFTIFKNIIFR